MTPLLAGGLPNDGCVFCVRVAAEPVTRTSQPRAESMCQGSRMDEDLAYLRQVDALANQVCDLAVEDHVRLPIFDH